MIISIDAEKGFDKIHHPFMLKTHSKVRMEGTFLNVIKAMYDNPIANIIFNGQKLCVFLKIRNKTGMPTITSLTQHSTGSPSHNNQTRRRNKMHPNWKEEVKLLLCIDDMILYIKSPKYSKKKEIYQNRMNSVK